jgi:hypothetical protein
VPGHAPADDNEADALALLHWASTTTTLNRRCDVGWQLDVEDVAARFEEAASTGRRLPPPVRVQGYFNTWPIIVRKEWEAFAADEHVYRPFPPTRRHRPDAGDDAWVQWLEVEQRHLVWMRAKRYGWRDITIRFACDRTTAWRRWQRRWRSSPINSTAKASACFKIVGKQGNACRVCPRFLRLSLLTLLSLQQNSPVGGSISAIFWTAVTVRRAARGKRVLPAEIPCGARARRFGVRARARLPVGRLPAPVTTPAQLPPHQNLHSPNPPGGNARRVLLWDIHFEHAQRRVPQGRGADSPAIRARIPRADRQDRGQHRRVRLDEPILVDGDNGIIAGTVVWPLRAQAGLDQVPVIELAHLTVAQKRARSSPTTGWRSTRAGTRRCWRWNWPSCPRRGTTCPDRLRGCRDRGCAATG